jgi:hypothetical protein
MPLYHNAKNVENNVIQMQQTINNTVPKKGKT